MSTTPDTIIDITAAIQARRAEIESLLLLKDELRLLIADAQRVAWGEDPKIPANEFEIRFEEARNTAQRLGLQLPFYPLDMCRLV